MESVCASELRSNLTEILKRIGSGKIISITLRGREVAKLVPTDNKAEKAGKNGRQLLSVMCFLRLMKNGNV